ncbi:hypothetical protein TrispH2_004789, partial [Trichoplax sp. H2]
LKANRRLHVALSIYSSVTGVIYIIYQTGIITIVFTSSIWTYLICNGNIIFPQENSIHSIYFPPRLYKIHLQVNSVI